MRIFWARGGAFRLEAKGIVTGVDLAIANQNILGGVDIQAVIISICVIPNLKSMKSNLLAGKDPKHPKSGVAKEKVTDVYVPASNQPNSIRTCGTVLDVVLKRGGFSRPVDRATPCQAGYFQGRNPLKTFSKEQDPFGWVRGSSTRQGPGYLGSIGGSRLA